MSEEEHKKIIKELETKYLGKFPKMYISDDEMEYNMQKYFSNIGEKLDIEPYCVPSKKYIKMAKKYLKGGKDE